MTETQRVKMDDLKATVRDLRFDLERVEELVAEGDGLRDALEEERERVAMLEGELASLEESYREACDARDIAMRMLEERGRL